MITEQSKWPETQKSASLQAILTNITNFFKGPHSYGMMLTTLKLFSVNHVERLFMHSYRAGSSGYSQKKKQAKVRQIPRLSGTGRTVVRSFQCDRITP